MLTLSPINIRPLLRGLFILTCLVATTMILTGCGDDDDQFEGADRFELQNTFWSFADLRVFNLENQSGTLQIDTFGSAPLTADEAPFTLTLTANQANAGVATGSVRLTEGDNPLGEDFSRCDFEVDVSTIAPPAAGLTDGDVNPIDCKVSEDGALLELRNRNTGGESTGTAAVQ